jgi:TolB-like protein
MKLIYINLFLLFFSINGFAQTSKVAILDFENTSGKTEYDALGKAMSSMLITDLSNNIHPKKVEFFERSQLNKLLDEQKLQKSKNFDSKTAVDFGKLSGVNYVFVGSVFVMDGNCNITSKLVDVQTSKIVLSKEVNGKIDSWLQLKSQLAEAIALQLNNPITLEPSYKDQSTTLATINQYGKVITTMDQGDFDKAEQLRSVFEETNPDFKYFKDITDDIIDLKKEMKEMKETIDDVLEPEVIALNLISENSEIDKALKYLDQFNLKSNYADKFGLTKKLFVYQQKARAYYRLGDLKKSIAYLDSTLLIDKNWLSGHYIKMCYMMGGEFVGASSNVKILKPDNDYAKEIEDCFIYYTSYGKKNMSTFNPEVYRQPRFNDNGACNHNLGGQECDYFDYSITLPQRNATLLDQNLMRDDDISDLRFHIIQPTNLYARYLISKNETIKALLILENCLFQQFEFLEGTSWLSTPGKILIHTKDRNFKLLMPQQKRDYANIVTLFNPTFKELAPRHLVGYYYKSPENFGFTDNIILLSNLLILNKRYTDALHLLKGFRTIFGEYTDYWGNKQPDYYNVECFKVSLNLLMFSKIAGKENKQLYEECKNLYEKEMDKILALYSLNNITFDQFLGERYKVLLDFFKNTEIKNGLLKVLEN